MAITTKKPFIYTQEHKYHGELASSSSTNTIPANGVTKLHLASTYNLAGPSVGSLVTMYCTAAAGAALCKILCVSTVAGSTGQVSFNSAGGTAQALFLCNNSTQFNSDVSVTMIGESATQWRIISAWPQISTASTLAGILVTT
jgi:hypothetical protein